MGGKKKRLLFENWFFYLFLSLILCIPGFGFAQEAAGESDEFTLEEIVVTGSRIPRRDYDSNSPIVTIKAEQFEQQSGLNVEAYLNQLPEYNPAASPVTTQQDVQITPVNSVGVATISLRGFGPNRNLTLVDGKRGVPVNALMWTDVNAIPSALIERVETISGGASAVYGADAVGGVTNFILKKNFEGFEFDAQYGIQQAGDGEENRQSILFGSNLADDRGNVTFGMERYERKTAYKKERIWNRQRWADPRAGGYFFFLQGTNGYACDPYCPTKGAVKALYGGQDPFAYYYGGIPDTGYMPGPQAYGPEYKFNADGTIFVTGNPIAESRARIVDDTLKYAYTTTINSAKDPSGTTTYEALKWNFLDEWASAPQDRFSLFASGNYDLTDKVRVFGGARFAQSKTRTLLFGTDLISGWESTVPYNPTIDSPIDPTIVYDAATYAAVAANPAAYFAAHPNPSFIPSGSAGAGHPVPAEMAWLLNSRADQNARWQPQWYPETSLPSRQTTNTIQTWQFEGGLDFDLPFKDWKGELYLTHGESHTYNVAGGSMSAQRYRTLINYPDWARGASGTGNMAYIVNSENGQEVLNTIRPGFGSGDFHCTSGFYDTIFGGDQPMSEDCFNAMNAVLQTKTEMTQDIYELNLQGGLFNLPAGEVRAAAGYQYRQVHGMFNPDILQSQDSFQDQVVGVYPTGYLDASTHVDDYYLELLVPILSDLPFVQKLELETGVRWSDYKETNNQEWTYKMLVNWQVKDWLRIRGGYNRAIRSPNLGELFLNQQEIFTFGGNFGDPCSPRANAPWGAGGTTLAFDENITATETPPALAAGQTQAGADYTQQLCEAMMGAVAADTYYRGIVGGVDGIADFANQGGGGGFAWVLQVGNPGLKPETADTWTAGFVMSSPAKHPLLSGISLAVDWYSIKIDQAIMLYTLDYASYRCFGTGLAAGITPADQAETQGCMLVPRDQNNGAALSSMLSYDNQATIDTAGFDIMVNWMADLAAFGLNSIPGNINLSMQATVLDKYITRASPVYYDLPTDWKGTLGPNLSGTQGGSYDYRLFTTLTYSNVRYPWSASLRWRHLPSVWSASKAENIALIENNTRVAAGGEGRIMSYSPSTEIKTPSYDIFDLSGNWDISEIFSVRFGIDNLFNTKPPYVASNAGRPIGTDLSTYCNGAPGCTNPTSYSLYSLGSFNAGYYDVLGRRFFMGIKARF